MNTFCEYIKMRLFHTKKLHQLTNCCKNIKNYCTNPKSVTEKLSNRSLLQLKGKDSSVLLQGLITNDVNHLKVIGSLYAMFLNTKGRVLFDTIIYKIPETDSLYIECDKSVAPALEKHLNMYRLRRDVTISNIDDKFQLWVNFNPDLIPKNPKEKIKFVDVKFGPCTNPEGADKATITEINGNKIFQFGDPRLGVLGNRIIASKECENSIQDLFGKRAESDSYKLFRYRLGQFLNLTKYKANVYVDMYFLITNIESGYSKLNFKN